MMQRSVLTLVAAAAVLSGCDAFTSPKTARSPVALFGKVNAGDIRNGVTLEIEGNVFKVLSFQQTKTARQAAMVRTKLKNLISGSNLDMTFRISETLETADVIKSPATYSYNDGDNVVFMDTETYDERTVPGDDIDNMDMLKDGMVCEITMWGEKVVDVNLPTTDTYEVTYTEQGLPKAASTNQLKAATLETGAEVKVPLFVNTGDVIKVNCAEKEYMERVTTKKF